MWMLTPQGMFSAVADAQEDVLQVRCRSKKDALGLAHWLVDNEQVVLNDDYPTVESLVLEWPGRDYPCRILLWREQWVAYVAWSVEQITYGNFKNEVKAQQGSRRAATYGRVWGVLLDIEREDQPSGKDQAWGVRDDGYALRDLIGTGTFTSVGSIGQGRLPMGINDTDDRCPRCDKFLSDVGITGEGDCKVCMEELDEAYEEGDDMLIAEILLELEMNNAT